MSHSMRAARALAHLGEVDPALAVLALWCKHRDAEGATRTRGSTILYGPSFAELALPEQVGLTAHHVLHVALRHSDRMADLAERLGERFEGVLFGLAADGIINETLELAGHALPRPTLKLTDLLQEIGEPVPSPVAALGEWDADRLAMYLHAEPQRAEKAREFGAKRGLSKDVELGEADDEGEMRQASDWRNQMLRALYAGRKAGTGIGRLGAILADLSPPGIPWEVQLRGLLAKALSDQPSPSFRRPSNRWAALTAQALRDGGAEPVFEPGRQRQFHRPRIVLGLDTSSSIDALTLDLFAAEAEGASRRTGAEAHLLAFDDAVHRQVRLGSTGWSLRGTDMRRGGGTDFAPVVGAAERLDPSILVMLTDLDAPFGPPPAFPVLWAVPKAPHGAPPFGRVLTIGE